MCCRECLGILVLHDDIQLHMTTNPTILCLYVPSIVYEPKTFVLVGGPEKYVSAGNVVLLATMFPTGKCPQRFPTPL